MIKSVVFVSLAVAATSQYAGQGAPQHGVPQYGAPQQGAAPGPLFQFSNSVNHAAAAQQSSAGPQAGYGAPPAPSYGAPQQQPASYGAPPAPPAAAAPQRGYALPSFDQLGAHNPAAGSGFANLGQLAQQNPAFNIPIPRGYEEPAAGAPQAGFQAGPAPAAAAYRPQPQYGAQQAFGGAPQGAPAGNPYGGPFSFSNSVSHSAPQQSAAPAAPAGGAPAARY